MDVIVRGKYAIAGNVTYKPEIPLVEIALPADGTAEVLLVMDLPQRSVEATGEYAISDEFFNLLRQEDQPTELPQAIDVEALRIRHHITSAVKRVLYSVKYCLKQLDLDENLFAIKNINYSFDNTNWKLFPGLKPAVTFSAYAITPLDFETARLILDHLNSGVKTFLALSFLHRAKKGRHPKYKWIDATIAAELAVKEFLVLIKPEVEALLLEVPSPPLDKLYGSILESYSGQRSPVVRQIAEGAKIRNRLVHRPEEIDITLQQAVDYVEDVEIAIGHLLSILNPSYYQRHW